jgi:hypothetical protein
MSRDSRHRSRRDDELADERRSTRESLGAAEIARSGARSPRSPRYSREAKAAAMDDDAAPLLTPTAETVQQTLQLYVRISELEEEVQDARTGAAFVDRSVVSRVVRQLNKERGAGTRQLEEENLVGWGGNRTASQGRA